MRRKKIKAKLKRVWQTLGPGLITGASDDDPAGIVTYAIAGAKTGFSLLWTAIFTLPLMYTVQEMCARIGIVTTNGLAGVMKKHYPRTLLYCLALLVTVASTVNIGADLSGMAEAASLIIPLPPLLYSVLFTILIIILMIKLPYRRIAQVLKWLAVVLLAYIFATFASRPDWFEVIKGAVFPEVVWNRETITIIVAIFGTTISPYLFFWQAGEQKEERESKSPHKVKHSVVTKFELKFMRKDVGMGMFFSNLVMFFIIANTGAFFHSHGITNLQTAGQVASSLEPLAGSLATILFAIGIVGTGLLAIPVLAGSTAYVIAETFDLNEGLNKPFHEAKAFYAVILFSTLLGFGMNFMGINPIEALFATAVIYGIVAPPLILVILDIVNRQEIMGSRINSPVQNLFGSLAFLVMLSAAFSYFIFAFAG